MRQRRQRKKRAKRFICRFRQRQKEKARGERDDLHQRRD